MLRGKKWLEEYRETIKDLSKTYKQARYAVLLLADMGNETIAGFNFASMNIERAIVEGQPRLWPALFVQKPVAEKCALFYIEPLVAEAVLLDWGYARGLLIEMCFRASKVEPYPVYRVEMTEDKTIFVLHPANRNDKAPLREKERETYPCVQGLA